LGQITRPWRRQRPIAAGASPSSALARVMPRSKVNDPLRCRSGSVSALNPLPAIPETSRDGSAPVSAAQAALPTDRRPRSERGLRRCRRVGTELLNDGARSADVFRCSDVA
jgi:hypothetical protein